MNIPQEENSSDEKINRDEFIKFNDESDSITEQPYSIKLVSIESDTSPCRWQSVT